MIKELYEEVQGTVYKCRNEYYLHLWELSDWDQEGMLCLHELISREEGLVDDIPRLRKYFKTKFRNRILDYIRKQESQKRRYDKEPYEEVGEISHRISEGGLWLDDYYLFHETLRDYRNKQSKEKQEELSRSKLVRTLSRQVNLSKNVLTLLIFAWKMVIMKLILSY
ncbi:competence-specific global transcription modulator [Streptococcus pneumoniae]|nr:competence-specific global transcription modulator [Streptococcus pneumoniae]